MGLWTYGFIKFLEKLQMTNSLDCPSAVTRMLSNSVEKIKVSSHRRLRMRQLQFMWSVAIVGKRSYESWTVVTDCIHHNSRPKRPRFLENSIGKTVGSENKVTVVP
jgi:hypothetical protein